MEEGVRTDSSRGQNLLLERAGRPAPGHPAGLDDAAGRALSAGIPSGAGKGRRLPRSVLQSGTCRRGDVAAGAALRLRCRDPVFRYPGGSACARAQGLVCGGRRAAARAADRCEGCWRLRASGRSTQILAPIYETVRRVKAALGRADGADRFLRRAMDGGDLYGRRARHARPGAGESCWPHREPQAFQHLIDCLVEASADYLARPVGSRRRCGADFRYLGRRRCRRMISSAGACSRPSDLVAQLREKQAGRQGDRLSARRRQEHSALCRGNRRRCGQPRQRDRSQTSRATQIQPRVPVQGNVDPLALARRRRGARPRGRRRSWRRFGGGPLIFNLGHGILPQTPIAHVEQMLKRVRG